MKQAKLAMFVLAASAAAAASAQESAEFDPSQRKTGELSIKSDYFAASRQTGELAVTGRVEAVSEPLRFFSDGVRRDASGRNDFGHAQFTTCTNEACAFHWRIDGEVVYKDHESVTVRNAVLNLFGTPVGWLPFWYYPLNTDYGFRAMPGYTSRWGGYLLTGYVYDIWNEGKAENDYSFGGSTYADIRTKNGFAVGQTVRWKLGDFGKGKLRMYHAWDEDYDRYDHHWRDHKRHYANWGSPVNYNRYGLALTHSADFTERDSLRVRASYLSDSHFIGDFFERNERMSSTPVNEVSYEHRENSYVGGLTVSGPVNKFYGGTARLPEAWFQVEPQPVFSLPVNYESQTHVGFLNRQYAKYEDAEPGFRYTPGRWADYQSFRADSLHRLTVPFKMWDVVSAVPRASYRATWYEDVGSTVDPGKAAGNSLYRGIYEAGITLSARGSRWFEGGWRHVVEPYLDYSYQNVTISSEGDGGSIYYFDNADRSYDWLDQFGFDGRGLPVRWHGVRPGIRNTFGQRDNQGVLRTVFESDIYAAVPFNEARFRADGRPHNPKNGNYNKDGDHQTVPGVALRWHPSKDSSLRLRTEYDCQNDAVAYSDIVFENKVSDKFSWHASYIGRDHRLWDYGDSEISSWNREKSNMVGLGFTQELGDLFAYSPFIRWDARRNELDEVGSWFEFRTDCLAFRFTMSFEDTFKRVDGSKREADFRVGFFVYLRAFGPSTMVDFGRF